MFEEDLAEMFANLELMQAQQQTIFDDKIVEIDALANAGKTLEALTTGRLYSAELLRSYNAMQQAVSTYEQVELPWLVRLTEGWKVEALAQITAESIKARDLFSVLRTTLDQHLTDIQFAALAQTTKS